MYLAHSFPLIKPASFHLPTKNEYILRQPDSQMHLSNFNEALQTGLNIILHITAGICYNHKGEIIFYNNPEDSGDAKQCQAPHSRKSKFETEKQYC